MRLAQMQDGLIAKIFDCSRHMIRREPTVIIGGETYKRHYPPIWEENNPEKMQQHSLVLVTQADLPSYDPITHKAVLVECVVGDAEPVDHWEVIPLTAEEITAREPPTADELATEIGTIQGELGRTELFLRALINWLADNRGVTELQAFNALKKIIRDNNAWR